MRIFILVGLLASSTAMAETNTVRISTGGIGNGYWNACLSLQKDFGTSTKIECLSSPGSQWNIEQLSAGNADLALVQADALAVAKKDGDVSRIDQIASVGTELVQLVCNKDSGIDEVSDLESISPRPKVLVGQQGSGPAITLRNWVIEDADYRNIDPIYESATGTGALKLKQNQVQCALIVSTLGGATMSTLDSGSGGKLALVDIDDGDFNDSTDTDGNPVYRFADIDSSTYKNLLGWSDVDTTSMDAILIGNSEFINSNPVFMDALARILFLKPMLLK